MHSPVLLASDFPIFRDSLKTYFETTPEIELVACANDQSEIIPLLESCEAKLILLDLNIEWNSLCSSRPDPRESRHPVAGHVRRTGTCLE